jgi:predicted nucleic acid-binding protein
MNEIFADTAGWANFFVRTEPFHAHAKNLMNQWQANGTHLITTNYTLVELVALFTRPLRISRAQQIAAIEMIKTTSWVEVVHIDRTLDEEAWVLLKERQDKTWSLVDCASFVVMRHRGITEAFTSDYHFEQAGFSRILR